MPLSSDLKKPKTQGEDMRVGFSVSHYELITGFDRRTREFRSLVSPGPLSELISNASELGYSYNLSSAVGYYILLYIYTTLLRLKAILQYSL